jgi:mannose-6-phosphate isomerase-like protein (cupin superfamily)
MTLNKILKKKISSTMLRSIYLSGKYKDVMEDMKDISSEEVEANHIARFLNLKVESVDGMRLRRLIGANDGDAALRTPHTIGVDFIEVEPGTQSEAYESDCREVYVALEGQPTILWSDRPVEMERLDVFSVAPRMKRAIAASGNSPALLLRVRDLTNKD